MQCAKCWTENREGSRFCAGCGAPLAAPCPECGFNNVSDAKFCSGCGIPLPGSADTETGHVPKTPEAERRQLTVMFCDLAGSTALSQELDPEDLSRIIRDYQSTAGHVIKRYDGFIARYMGDGILAYFGYPHAHEDDAARAVHAGLEITREIQSLDLSENRAVAVRVGIATGRVVVGELIGEGAAEEAAVVGETPNLAARLQAIAEPNGVVVSDNTRELAGGLFDYADSQFHELKGFSQPARAWRVLRASDIQGRFDAQRATIRLTPFIGRTDEFSLLKRRWREAKDGDGQIVLLCGQAGIGKSRITATLLDELAAERPARLRYYCSEYYQNSALHPFIAQLERAAKIAQSDSPKQRLDKLESLLARWQRDPAADVPLLAALLSIPTDDRYPPLDIVPAAQKLKTFEFIELQLETLAAHQPVLVVFEDAHWIDPTSLELLDRLIDRAQDLPVLMIVNARPEFTPGWTRFGHVTSLTLNHLGRRQCVEMVKQVSGGRKLPPPVLETLVRKTQGVPLFVEQLTKSVLESDILKKPDRYDALSGSELDLAIPATLHDSLMARLDRIGDAKLVAQVGAVIGREFTHELLAALSPVPEETLRTSLEKLARSELVIRRGEPPNARYRFNHALVQDAAYQSLLKQTKRQYHRQIAEIYEKRFPKIVETEPELLAHHYTLAGLKEKAIGYWQQAGEKAAGRSANREAISHLRSALKLIEDLPEEKTRADCELAVLIALGPALMASLGWDAAEVQDAYARARRLAHENERPAELFPAIWGSWLVAHAGGKAPLARKLLDELFGLAESQSDPTLILQAHHAGGSTMCSDGEFHQAQHHIETGIRLYRKGADSHQALRYGGHDPCVCAHSLGALNQMILGHLDQSQRYSARAMDLAKEINHAPSAAHAHWYRAELCQIHGQVDEAAERAEIVLSLATEKGMAQYAAWAVMTQGWALTMRGEPRQGLARLREGLSSLRANKTRYHLPHRVAMLAQALALAGELDEAMEIIDEVITTVEDTGERWFEAEAQRLKAVMLLTRPQPDVAQAEQGLRTALDAARKRQATFWELRAAADLADLWRAQGSFKEAHDLLAPICGRFTDDAESADINEARMLVAELSASLPQSKGKPSRSPRRV